MSFDKDDEYWDRYNVLTETITIVNSKVCEGIVQDGDFGDLKWKK